MNSRDNINVIGSKSINDQTWENDLHLEMKSEDEEENKMNRQRR